MRMGFSRWWLARHSGFLTLRLLANDWHDIPSLYLDVHHGRPEVGGTSSAPDDAVPAPEPGSVREGECLTFDTTARHVREVRAASAGPRATFP